MTKEELLPSPRAACKGWVEARPRDADGELSTDGVCSPISDTEKEDCVAWLLELVNIEPPIHLK